MTKPTKKMNVLASPSNVGLDCPNCENNQGWWAQWNHYTGEAEQVQCEFCYCEPNSKFNVARSNPVMGGALPITP